METGEDVSKPLRSKWDLAVLIMPGVLIMFQSHYGRNGTHPKAYEVCMEKLFQSHYGRNGTKVDIAVLNAAD